MAPYYSESELKRYPVTRVMRRNRRQMIDSHSLCISHDNPMLADLLIRTENSRRFCKAHQKEEWVGILKRQQCGSLLCSTIYVGDDKLSNPPVWLWEACPHHNNFLTFLSVCTVIRTGDSCSLMNVTREFTLLAEPQHITTRSYSKRCDQLVQWSQKSREQSRKCILYH